MNKQNTTEQPTDKGILDLPYEIYSQIYKKLPLRGIQALSISHKRLYHTYENLNISIADKIAFNSKFDFFEDHKHLTTLKEILVDLYDLEIDFEQCLKFCFNQKEIEKIKIIGILNDNFVYANIPFTDLTRLKEIQISIIAQNKPNIDYLLPIVECTKILEKITFENGTLSRNTMMEISKNRNIKFMKLHNVTIYDIRSFRTLLTLLPDLEEFHYYNFSFIRMLAVTRTLEAIFNIVFASPKLQHVKISAWQELNADTLRETCTYKTEHYSFNLLKGNAVSFFSAILPLMQHNHANTFEIFYSNPDYTKTEDEKASIRYKLADCCASTLKSYKYSTH